MDYGSIFKTTAAIGGGALSYLFGGWDALIGVLLAFVVIDFSSGVTAAYIKKELSSRKSYEGIARKAFIFAMVSVAHFIDTALGGGSLVRDATIFFYLANELLSIVVNSGKIGLPVPSVIMQAVETLNGKGGHMEAVEKDVRK